MAKRSVEEIQAEAIKRAGNYEWMAAANLYRQALDLLNLSRESSQAANVSEALARSYFKGAFQAESREEFKRIMHLAKSSYERTANLYEKLDLEALLKRANARSLFAAFWIEDSPVNRKEIVERCFVLADEAAQIFEHQGDRKALAETLGNLLTYSLEGLPFIGEWKHLEERFESAVQVGEKAISEFEAIGDAEGLLESLYVTLLVVSDFILPVLGPAEFQQASFQEWKEKSEKWGNRVAEVSAKIGTAYADCIGKHVSVHMAFLTYDPAKYWGPFEAAAAAAENVKDSLTTGRILTDLTYVSAGVGLSQEDMARRREVLERGIEYASVAIKNLEIPLHDALLEMAHGLCSENHTYLAFSVETETKERIRHLRKAIEIARKGMVYGSKTRLVPEWSTARHALSKAMYFLATMGVDPAEKVQLLKESLVIREETVRTYDLLPPHSWDRGVMRNYLALVKAELSNTEQDPKVKTELLQGAVSDMQQCMDICSKFGTADFAANLIPLSLYSEWFGDILLQLNKLAQNVDTAKRAIRAYEGAVAYLGMLGMVGRGASVWWKMARVHDRLGDFKEASTAFGKAAETYRAGSQKIPSLASVFEDLAFYMDAWVKIMDARIRHGQEQHSSAAEQYAQAANLLQATKSWSHLSKHYTGCALLEEGEVHSSQEKEGAAIESFSAAAKAFQEAKTSLEKRQEEAFESEEQEEAKEWFRVVDGRERYSLGRIELEEARVLDRKGDKPASSAKYHSASDLFKGLSVEAADEQEHRELETLMQFCSAWAKMKEAEAEGSPSLYAEAADSFIRAEESASKKRDRLLAGAYASICKALESGARFRRTRNIELYTDIKKHLETSADYYAEAGFHNAADWTRATQRLFDALIYLANAEVQVEPKKKSELYHLAEKCLDLAARLYGEAGFPAKKEEALRYLARAREDKELLLMPDEVLVDHPSVSGTTIASVSLLRDEALGLERFDAARVVGNLTVPQNAVKVGEDITLGLEMANVGKAAAILMKLDGIMPDGFKLDEERTSLHFEKNSIHMKGKRLEYLQTYGVEIPLKAVRKGTYEIRPRVLFVDEKGSYRSYEFDPIPVTVSELGISGWIRGPQK